MLRTALQFIEQELNNFMLLRDGDSYSPSERPAVLAPLVKRDGSITTDPGRIYITLTHLEEERLENKKMYICQIAMAANTWFFNHRSD